MTLPVYGHPRDVYRYGALPRGLLTNEGRFATVDPTSNRFELAEHGFAADDPILVRATDGGSLPSPLVSGTTYYAIPTDDSGFRLAATAGGAAIDLTTAGASVLVLTPLPLLALCSFYSRWIDGVIPHVLPLVEPYPELVVGCLARLVGKAALNADGKQSALVAETELAAKAQLERWAAGIPIRDDRVTSSANLAISGAALGGALHRRPGCLP